MNAKLLPCPFCGGEAHVWRYFEGRYAVHCNECTARLALYGDHPKEETIAAWNTRAERTCRMETSEGCHNWNSCSQCGADYYTDQPINYCPSCGAKVVN